MVLLIVHLSLSEPTLSVQTNLSDKISVWNKMFNNMKTFTRQIRTGRCNHSQLDTEQVITQTTLKCHQTDLLV